MRKQDEIIFFSEGVPISGTFSRNENFSKPSPAVILAHGYANYRGEFGGFDELSSVLNESGFAVLRFDFRGCGDSGEKGRMLCATEWPSDLMNAITWLYSREEINQKKIGIVGQSMGAATTALISSLDDRIACAICMAPTSDGRRWLEDIWCTSKSRSEWEGFWDSIKMDRLDRVLTGNSKIKPIFELLGMNTDGKENWISLNKKFPKFLLEAPMESIDSVSLLRPIDSISASKSPLLFIHGQNDVLVPSKNSIELFEKANDPKELFLIAGAGHDLPIGDFKNIVQHKIIEFLNQYLR